LTAHDFLDNFCLAVADLECHEGIRGEEALAGYELGNGVIEIETGMPAR